MRHFAYLARYNNPKNELQLAALGVLVARSRRIVPDASHLIAEITEEILALNTGHPRCQPLRVRTWTIGSGIGLGLGDHFTVSFHLYEIRENNK